MCVCVCVRTRASAHLCAYDPTCRPLHLFSYSFLLSFFPLTELTYNNNNIASSRYCHYHRLLYIPHISYRKSPRGKYGVRGYDESLIPAT